MPGLELDEDVNIAVGSEVVTQDRPEESETPNVIAPTEVSKLFLIDCDSRTHALTIPHSQAILGSGCASC